MVNQVVAMCIWSTLIQKIQAAVEYYTTDRTAISKSPDKTTVESLRRLVEYYMDRNVLVRREPIMFR